MLKIPQNCQDNTTNVGLILRKLRYEMSNIMIWNENFHHEQGQLKYR